MHFCDRVRPPHFCTRFRKIGRIGSSEEAGGEGVEKELRSSRTQHAWDALCGAADRLHHCPTPGTCQGVSHAQDCGHIALCRRMSIHCFLSNIVHRRGTILLGGRRAGDICAQEQQESAAGKHRKAASSGRMSLKMIKTSDATSDESCRKSRVGGRWRLGAAPSRTPCRGQGDVQGERQEGPGP